MTSEWTAKWQEILDFSSLLFAEVIVYTLAVATNEDGGIFELRNHIIRYDTIRHRWEFNAEAEQQQNNKWQPRRCLCISFDWADHRC